MFKEYLIRYTISRDFTTGIAVVVAKDPQSAAKLLQSQGKYNGSIYQYRILTTDLINDTDQYNAEAILEEISTGPGFSAYEIAVKYGYKGSEEDWIKSLKGDKGDSGPQGPRGPQGPQGETGPTPIVSTPITYLELVNLVQTQKLSKGTYYRITDYVTTTSKSGTHSANHPFDVIVLALSNSVLSEQALATQRENDNYFACQKLEAWKIKYCLNNDILRFDWANRNSGKGVIYDMIDEYDNRCPYDFKNIQFQRFKLIPSDGSLDASSSIFQKYLGLQSADLHSLIGLDTTDSKWYYTFSKETSNGQISDLSVTDGYRCKENTILHCMSSGAVRRLNDIVFITDTAVIEQNKFDYHCLGMSFYISTTGQFAVNHFGQNCKGNILDVNTFVYNNIGNECKQLLASAQLMTYNNIGHLFKSNAIFSNCTLNIIGGTSNGNIITGPFNNNTIGQFFRNNTINGTFESNIVGPFFSKNKVEGEFAFSTLDKQVQRNTFNDITYVNIGTACTDNNLTRVINSRIGCLFINNTLSDVKACTFGIGFRYNKFTKTDPDTHRSQIIGCSFGDYIWYTRFYCSNDSDARPISNLRVSSMLQGSAEQYLEIEVPINMSAEYTVAKNSDGQVKVFCMADLVE